MTEAIKGMCPGAPGRHRPRQVEMKGDARTVAMGLRAAPILDPPKRHVLLVCGALVGEGHLDVLEFALAHARGDWRRALISRRIAEVRKVHDE